MLYLADFAYDLLAVGNIVASECHAENRNIACAQGLDGEQAVIDRPEHGRSDDDHRQFQGTGKICVKAVLGEWRVKATGALDDQQAGRIVSITGVDKRREFDAAALESRRAMRCWLSST